MSALDNEDFPTEAGEQDADILRAQITLRGDAARRFRALCKLRKIDPGKYATHIVTDKAMSPDAGSTLGRHGFPFTQLDAESP